MYDAAKLRTGGAVDGCRAGVLPPRGASAGGWTDWRRTRRFAMPDGQQAGPWPPDAAISAPIDGTLTHHCSRCGQADEIAVRFSGVFAVVPERRTPGLIVVPSMQGPA